MLRVDELTRDNFNRLVKEAPESETRLIRKHLIDEGIDPFDFFQKRAIEKSLLSNGRPVYFGALVKVDGKYNLFTVVNKNVKEQKSLYKLSKQIVSQWVKKYKTIYAKMDKSFEKNLFWTKKMGFLPIEEDNKYITLKKE